MNEIHAICREIQENSSTLMKQEILRNNEANEDFKKAINFLLNPFVVTGLSGKKISKAVALEPTVTLETLNEAMDYLAENNTGTDEVISNVRAFLDKQPEELREFCESLFTKSLRLGCDVKTVNKVYGAGFIPQWEVQQSYSIEKYELDEGEWFSLSEKLNGVRGTYYRGKIISRQGKELSGLGHITEDIAALELGNVVLDGELVRRNDDNLPDNENFRIAAGIINSDSLEKPLIQFIIFDILPVEEFDRAESEETYRQRLEKLNDMRAKVESLGLKNIRIVDVVYSGTDQSVIDGFLEEMVRRDKEGLILNRDAPYKCKRHNGVLKVKRFYTIDLEVTGIEEGGGRLAGVLGSFIVDYKGNPLNVGSGMSDEQRKEFWDNREALIGRVIEVKFKEESKDKKSGKTSLQFPIFVALREEGKTVSFD